MTDERLKTPKRKPMRRQSADFLVPRV